MKIAIVGSAASTCDKAPFDDPSWEIWGLAWRKYKRVDKLFEIHHPNHWHKYTDGNYLEFLKSVGHRLVITSKNPELPEADIMHKTGIEAYIPGVALWTSSISHMLAYAFMLHPEEIAIYGVDLLIAEEYGQQRPTIEYLIGYCRGNGIKVTIPEQSALCKANFNYGDENDGNVHLPKGITTKFLEGRLAKYRADRAATQERMNAEISRLNTLDGVIDEDVALLEMLAHYGRGGVIPGAD